MKKQLLALTALMALFAANSIVAMLPVQPLDPNKALDIQKFANDIKAISKQKLIPGQTGVYIPPVNIGDIETSIKSASLINLKNEAIAGSTLKESFIATINQLDTEIEKAQLDSREVDQITKLLTRLYNGESASTLLNSLPGLKEGPVGRLFAFIANSGNIMQKLHSHLEPLLPVDGIAAHGGGVITPTNEKMQHFIAYAIGKLAIYKNNLPTISQKFESAKRKAQEAAEDAKNIAKEAAQRAKAAVKRTIPIK